MYFRRTLKPRPPRPLSVRHYQKVQLDLERKQASIDGRMSKAKAGCWMFYLVDDQAKLFHARNGYVNCKHTSRPPDATIKQTGTQIGRYLSDEWHAALTTSITHRLAELWIVSARLWLAGLGPQPLGVCFVNQLEQDGESLGPTCGFLSENVHRLRPKLRCRAEQLEAAGVRPDKIMSCIRQQVRGYVIDLCSVVGCMPINAEPETAHLESLFREHPSDDVLIHELQRFLTQE